MAIEAGESIYDVIRARLDPAGRLPEPLTLPDEEAVTAGGIRWAAGALDGAFGHHVGGGQSDEKARKAADLFAKACSRPSKRNLAKLYEAVSDPGAIDFVDPMIKRLSELSPDRSALHDLGRWLATTAADRGPVKVGIAIIGVTDAEDEIDVLRTLGAHEEFTLYAAVALTNGLEDAESELWALASSVDGWGRIHCVERLAGTDDEQIQDWILREGFRNSIMYEYLAYIAATTGGLVDALEQPAEDVDRELLTAAGEILHALVQGGPAESLDHYQDGADAVGAYLAHMDDRAETLLDDHALRAIRSYLTSAGDWDERSKWGWTATRREAFEAKCDEILGRDEWGDRIAVGLLSTDPSEFWRASESAQAHGIDTFDIHVAKIEDDPLDGPWFQAWRQVAGAGTGAAGTAGAAGAGAAGDGAAGDGTGAGATGDRYGDRDGDERARRLAALATERLPLDDIATGPADEIGLGPDWRPHIALDWTLQALRDHVGVGGDLLLVGLRSPVTRNRKMVLKVLQRWPEDEWPDGARALAETVERSDPNERTREFAGQVLRGEPADE